MDIILKVLSSPDEETLWKMHEVSYCNDRFHYAECSVESPYRIYNMVVSQYYSDRSMASKPLIIEGTCMFASNPSGNYQKCNYIATIDKSTRAGEIRLKDVTIPTIKNPLN